MWHLCKTESCCSKRTSSALTWPPCIAVIAFGVANFTARTLVVFAGGIVLPQNGPVQEHKKKKHNKRKCLHTLGQWQVRLTASLWQHGCHVPPRLKNTITQSIKVRLNSSHCSGRSKTPGEVQVHQNHFHQKTTFIKNHFHQKPFSSKTIFIRDHFHQKPFSSKTNYIKNQFHQSTSCQRDPPPEQKQYSPCLCESVAGRRPATPSHKNGLCPPLGSQLAFLLNIAGRRPAMFSRKAR